VLPSLSLTSLCVYTPPLSVSGIGKGNANFAPPGVKSRLLTEFVVSDLVAEDTDDTLVVPGTRGHLEVVPNGVVPKTHASDDGFSCINNAEHKYRLQCISFLQAALSREQHAVRELQFRDRASSSTFSINVSYRTSSPSRATSDLRRAEAVPLLWSVAVASR